jgi:putative hydrolase of the HAD superfamily
VAFRAVIFDLGGVVVPSPLDAFREYEREHGLPHRFLSEVVLGGGEHGAWSRLERGELTMAAFGEAFEAECADAGGTVVATELFAVMHNGSGPRPEMLTAITRIRDTGLRVAALTNNWRLDDDVQVDARDRQSVMDMFDVVIESAVEGLRKPDPRIYELACTRLGVTPEEAVFLDDLGANLKPARALGMATIKVEDPARALEELGEVLGLHLVGPAAT